MHRKHLLFLLIISYLMMGSAGAGDPATVKTPLVIGIEYTFPGQANAFAKAGLTGAKYFPDLYEWGDMQKRSNGSISFYETDRYVTEFQQAGFTSLTMALQSKSEWASKDAKGLKPKNLTPKPEFNDQFRRWVSAIVERYDGDGVDDMPGLKVPVVYYEIGTEFSTYVPESVDEYIGTLRMAYEAAHQVFPDVKILHAAFLTTTALTGRSTPETFESDFIKEDKRILYHSLADNRKLLDHPELFDLLNFHSCGDPFEIEGIVRWLKWEMGKRGYSKDIYISDTTPTPFIAWGNAVDCNLKTEQMGIVVPPFVEADRCRITPFFKKILDNDKESLNWLYGFLATDVVKKCVVAADMHVVQINTSFSEDLFWLKLKVVKAGAGTGAWGGMLETKADGKTNMRTVTGYRPMYYALQQVQVALKDYESIERVTYDDPHVRVYKIIRNKKESFIAWYEADKIPLPGEVIPSEQVSIKVSSGTQCTVRNTIQFIPNGQPDPGLLFPVSGNKITLKITSVPRFIE